MRVTEIQNFIKLFLYMRILIRKDFIPSSWTNNVESHFSFEIGLIEKRNNSIGEIRFKLCVKVLFGVDINKTNTSTAIIIVFITITDTDFVVLKLKFGRIQFDESLFSSDLLYILWLIIE